MGLDEVGIGAMNYDLIFWMHDHSEEAEPYLFLIEYTDSGAVPRMIEVYRSGETILKIPEDGCDSVFFLDYSPEEKPDDDAKLWIFTATSSDFDKFLKLVTRTEIADPTMG